MDENRREPEEAGSGILEPPAPADGTITRSPQAHQLADAAKIRARFVPANVVDLYELVAYLIGTVQVFVAQGVHVPQPLKGFRGLSASARVKWDWSGRGHPGVDSPGFDNGKAQSPES